MWPVSVLTFKYTKIKLNVKIIDEDDKTGDNCNIVRLQVLTAGL
jgi:hypothetical protein